ncbi:hypothetical protein HYV84_07210 [Candidatus Woesearchaeota archaeon]|nr:hypothetical protein [Candidatus Woesearchaeota archaeon]
MRNSFRLICLIVLAIFIIGCQPRGLKQETSIVPERVQENAEKPNESNLHEPETSIPAASRGQEDIGRNFDGGSPFPRCSGKFIKLSYPPVNLDKITYIIPMGGLAGEHVAPIDHQYYQNFFNKEANIEVYAPADGIVTDIQHMGSFRGDQQREPFDDYRIVIEHTCTISTIFIHIDRLSDRIKAVAPKPGEYTSVNVPVKAGEVIGWFDSNVDFNAVDKEFSIRFINPESYEKDPNRAHIQDPFYYYDEPLKTKLMSKSLRTAKPEGGTIDYDIDGALTGTWFKEGTKGWGGLKQERYWADHLAVVPNNIDPEHFILSIGTFNGIARQFGVKGNAPEPSTVGKETGLVKYELVEYKLYDGSKEFDYRNLAKGLKAKNDDFVQGVALVQLLEDRKLKFEAFPGKTADEVNGFSERAQIYVR